MTRRKDDPRPKPAEIKRYRVFHWDTFDNEVFMVFQTDSLDKALAFISTKYGKRIGIGGADKIDVVDIRGNIIRQYSVS